MDGLKRKDTTKGPPLRILSLDGGGVRGYSIFIILQEIMHRTFVEIEGRAPHRNEIPKPADHFDLIVGTGTGGLIALMLGRLRLDIETCKELYVRMTRMVFETDKTILGIPTRPTLFKASRLEEAIKEAVREHTVDEDEGKDGSGSGGSGGNGGGLSASRTGASGAPRRHASNASVVSFSARSPAAQMARPYYSNFSRGNPNALLYDSREYRTKTVVTAMYKNSPRGDEPVLLRSYDSRKEPAPEFDCRIWEAGRATCAIGLAFKPIQIGQSVFHDSGSGTFNPSQYALDEAAANEWPGREVGVFLSVGTGKRPRGSDNNNPQWYDGFMGEFAEARRRLIAKIEGCEKIHEQMVRDHLPRRGVNVENYYRLNVEVGVGEFGMNEWHRLAEISTGTKRYLSRHDERGMVQSAASKMAKIHRANERYNRMVMEGPPLGTGPGLGLGPGMGTAQFKVDPEVSMPLAVELPGDIPVFSGSHYTPRQSYESGAGDNLSVPAGGSPSMQSNTADRFRPSTGGSGSSIGGGSGGRTSSAAHAHTNSAGGGRGGAGDDRLMVTSPTPEQWRKASSNVSELAAGPASASTPTSGSGPGSRRPYPQQTAYPQRVEPPPLPPKTPLPDSGRNRPGNSGSHSHGGNVRRPTGYPVSQPPYPVDDDEAPPPPVNKARKPEYRR